MYYLLHRLKMIWQCMKPTIRLDQCTCPNLFRKKWRLEFSSRYANIMPLSIYFTRCLYWGERYAAAIACFLVFLLCTLPIRYVNIWNSSRLWDFSSIETLIVFSKVNDPLNFERSMEAQQIHTYCPLWLLPFLIVCMQH